MTHNGAHYVTKYSSDETTQVNTKRSFLKIQNNTWNSPKMHGIYWAEVVINYVGRFMVRAGTCKIFWYRSKIQRNYSKNPRNWCDYISYLDFVAILDNFQSACPHHYFVTTLWYCDVALTYITPYLANAKVHKAWQSSRSRKCATKTLFL